MTQTYKKACAGSLEELLRPEFFKALSDPNRVVLVARLSEQEGPSTVSEAAGCCPVDLSVVSRHLAMLRDAGVVVAERKGRRVFYSVDHAELAGTLRAIADALEACCPPDDEKENADADR